MSKQNRGKLKADFFLKYGESQFNYDSQTYNPNMLSFSTVAFLKNYTCKYIIN